MKLQFGLSELFEKFECRTILALIVVEKGFGVDKHGNNDVPLSTFNEIVESNGFG